MSVAQRVLAQADVAVSFVQNAKALAAQNATLVAEVSRLKHELSLRAIALNAENAQLGAQNAEVTMLKQESNRRAEALAAENARLTSENGRLTTELAALRVVSRKHAELKGKISNMMRARAEEAKPDGSKRVDLSEPSNRAPLMAQKDGAAGAATLATGAGTASAAQPSAAEGRADALAHMQVDALELYSALCEETHDDDGDEFELELARSPDKSSKGAKEAAAAAGGAQKRPLMPHVQVVRRKQERAALPARTCSACDAFYRATGVAGGACGECSRHRSAYAFAGTPPGFWNAEFDETMTEDNPHLLRDAT